MRREERNCHGDRGWTRLAGRWLGALVMLLSLVLASGAQQKTSDLTKLSLEDLMNLQVTSVSKKDQKISQAAAAIFVITQEDIRRSGATNIPDLLRMVPGMDVAQINANNWAVSARGFNGQFANKLLVLVDGRAVYTPLLAGVNWDTQDVPLEDLERIEVIRGPGATLWGANAVNGVINIITKKASETQGILITTGGGTQAQALATARYGGTFGKNGSYRVFTKYQDDKRFPDLAGQNAQDGWHLLHGGFRVDDSISKKDSLTIQGDIYTGNEGASIVHIFSVDPPVMGNTFPITELLGGNILGRWDQVYLGCSDSTFQLYFVKYTRSGPEAAEARDTVDFDFDHHLMWGARHDVMLGAGYRFTSDQTAGTIDQAFIPASRSLQLFSSFVQDTITLQPNRVFLTLGTKLEHNDYGGFELQPSVRMAWTPSPRRTFWAAVSRANRTPARHDSGVVAALAAFPDPGGSSTPVEPIVFGDPRVRSEHVLAFEAGYRGQPYQQLSLDMSAFFNVYDHLINFEPGTPFLQTVPAPSRTIVPFTWENNLYGTTAGGEVSATWKVTHRWTLNPGYALLRMHLHTRATSQDTNSAPDFEGSNPRQQGQLRSHVDLSHHLAWDASAYFVGPLPFQEVHSYTRVDTQLSWQLSHGMLLSVVGQNLVQDHHLESLDVVTVVNASQPKRSVYAKITWQSAGR